MKENKEKEVKAEVAESRENQEIETAGAKEAPAFSYTLRPLKATDLGVATRIISKLGLEEIAQCFGYDNIVSMVQDLQETQAIGSKPEGDLTNEDREKLENSKSLQLGAGLTMKVIQIIMEHYEKVQNDIINLMADLAGLTYDDVNNNLKLFFWLIGETLKKEELTSFLSFVSKFQDLGMKMPLN